MHLLTSLALRSKLVLPNWLVMAPMTRYRATEDGTSLPTISPHVPGLG